MTKDLPKAILLDLDDTILADSVNAAHCWQVVCKNAAAELSGSQPQALLAEIDKARKWYWSDPGRHRRGRFDIVMAWQEIVDIALLRLKINSPELAQRIAEDHLAQRREMLRPFPGALETLGCLRERSVRLALVTNGSASFQRRKIERFGLASFFEVILIEGEFGAGKPDERVYRHILDRFDTLATETWMVGDNLEWDVAGPQRLGIFGIWLDHSGSGTPEPSMVKPDRIIRALAELV